VVTAPYTTCGTTSATQSVAAHVRGSVTPSTVIGVLLPIKAPMVASRPLTTRSGRPAGGAAHPQQSTIAVLQGGYLLSSTKRDIRPMRNALAAALGQLKSYAPPSKQSP
jgi:ABC-type Fe2+-enterobactin transport system substrate-binding protein